MKWLMGALIWAMCSIVVQSLHLLFFGESAEFKAYFAGMLTVTFAVAFESVHD